MQKKVMLLGGNYFQMTATKAAKELGCHVISVDYLPDNPAHKYADEYHNVSTTDREAILKLAKELQIDGIVSYASDVSAPTAAYVSEKFGLPGNPLQAVEILTHKDKMREFMETHGFRSPKGKAFAKYEDAYDFFEHVKKPVMVKPVDASGSKGVSQVYHASEMQHAWQQAWQHTRCGRVVVEEFIERDGYQIAGDGFLIDGKIAFAGLMNEHFDCLCNPLVPIGESYPSILPEELRETALTEIQRLLSLLGMKMGAVNLDFIVDRTGDVYILEIGPRNGGNLITDAIRAANKIDLAKLTILAAIGEECVIPPRPLEEMMVSSYILHSLENGFFDHIDICDTIRKDILLMDIWVKNGDPVNRFEHGGFGLGAALIRHPDMKTMCERMDHMEKYIKVITK